MKNFIFFLLLPWAAFSQTVTVKTVNDSTFQIVTENVAIDGSGFTQVSKYMTAAELQQYLFETTMQSNAQKAQIDKQAQITQQLTASYKKAFETRGGKYETKVNEVLGKVFSGTYKITFGDEKLGRFILDDKMFLSGKNANYPVEIVNPSTIRVSGLAKEVVTLESRDGVNYLGIGDEKKVEIVKVSNETKGAEEVKPVEPEKPVPPAKPAKPKAATTKKAQKQ